jgi:hypothetical protein
MDPGVGAWVTMAMAVVVVVAAEVAEVEANAMVGSPIKSP